MSGRQDKKFRQMVNREMRKLDFGVRAMIKEPPRFFPPWIWYRLQKIFLNV